MRKILAHVGAFPSFVPIIRAFGQKAASEDDSYGGFCFAGNPTGPSRMVHSNQVPSAFSSETKLI